MNTPISFPARRQVLVKNCGATTHYCKVIVLAKRMKEYSFDISRAKKSIANDPELRDFFEMPVAGYDLPVITKGDCRNYFVEITNGITRYE